MKETDIKQCQPDSKELMQKLQSYTKRCLQFFLKIRWPENTSNEKLWRITIKRKYNNRSRKGNGSGWDTRLGKRLGEFQSKCWTGTPKEHGKEEDRGLHGGDLLKRKQDHRGNLEQNKGTHQQLSEVEELYISPMFSRGIKGIN
ncbi:hypothetical protein L798_13254 [Zootermopsis nevadensis]|uniref:Uncharacterized protein n=1 Tax=Zootermopsis nevadensis TaxID=136037 RepID=A0A067R4D5_ZOONE|nr:hypothetical protein L798_13254 [Zootermopsis nevadensis]